MTKVFNEGCIDKITIKKIDGSHEAIYDLFIMLAFSILPSKNEF